MRTFAPRTFTAMIASAALLLPLAVPAAASQVSVQPMLLWLSRSSANSCLRLENNGAETVRLQIKGFAWSETAEDDVSLVPTNDLTVFPSLVTLKTGEHRSVCIGSAVPVEATEKRYRIEILALAALPNSRITIPVFVAPLAYNQQHDTLAAVNVRAKSVTLGVTNPGNMHTLVSVTVAVTNPGNMHSLVHEVRIAAKDADGTTLFTGLATGSYVLPGLTRTYSIAKYVPPSLCARINSVGIEITTDGAPIHGSAPAQPACAQ